MIALFSTQRVGQIVSIYERENSELDVSLANKLSEEVKPDLQIVANAKELDSKNNTTTQNNQSSKSTLESRVRIRRTGRGKNTKRDIRS